MHMHFSPRGTRWSWRLPLVAALVLCGLTASARATPPGSESSSKHYSRETIFRLPIRIEEKSRATIKEVQLYVKAGQGGWQLVEKAPPSQETFKFQAPQDGEYWFTLVTVDTKGTATPSDVNRVPLDEIVMVVVDTQAPAFNLEPTKLSSGDVLLRCTVTDANPDYKALKITYRGPDQMLKVIEQLPGQPGMFRAGSEVYGNALRVSVTDLAGNTTTKEVTLPAPAETVVKAPPEVPGKSTMQGPIVQAGGNVPHEHGVVQAGGASVVANSGLVQAGGNNAVAPPPAILPETAHAPASTPPQTAPVTVAGETPRQLINTNRAALEYRIDQVGPSGVGKVEVWLTSDNGSSWHLLTHDMDRHSPAEFDLPGDGVYGVRLVITNGNGFGARAPQAGDAPQCWIEVDTTPPVVQLREIEPVTNGGSIDIRWLASDKNLGSGPISLFFATRKDGPWQPIARGLKNDGLHHWVFPRDQGSQFFVRLEVADMAGNVIRAESPSALMLDMTEPRASVLGINGIHGVQPPH